MSAGLKDRVVIVTGASKGIGAGIAKAFGRAGASVVVNYASSRSGADAVVSGIEAAGGRAAAVQANVAEEADVKHLFAQTLERFGRVDVLVNNAGVYGATPIAEVTADEFHRQYNINVLGLLLASREAAAAFGDRGGSIINISSSISTLAMPQMSIYAGTKGAVDTITKVLAKELGPKIRVNSVNPGAVFTEGAAGFFEEGGEFRTQLEQMSPLGRIGEPDDIAGAVVFLASDAASWVTGETWGVNGGVK